MSDLTSLIGVILGVIFVAKIVWLVQSYFEGQFPPDDSDDCDISGWGNPR